ncbi:hypothetical protein ACH7OW_002313 [Escherichia coli]
MDYKSVFELISAHLRWVYQIPDIDIERINLVNRRAIKLTRLYFLMNESVKHSPESITLKSVLSVLLYNASNGQITDPLSVSPSLVIHFLNPQLDAVVFPQENILSQIESQIDKTYRWLLDRQTKGIPFPEDLPELRWCDLPDLLFADIVKT